MSNESAIQAGPSSKQEVAVTDIRMPFGSMVLFMVKWAIASIPAVLILVVMTVSFWTLAIGFVASVGTLFTTGISSLFHMSPDKASNPAPTKRAVAVNPAPMKAQDSEEAAYIKSVLVKSARVEKGLDGGEGVVGEIKNTGDRTLKLVDITIYCLDKDGEPVFEKTYHAVIAAGGFLGEEPLKPRYSRQYGVRLDDAPSDWAKKVDVKVSQVKFQ
jgi:hypothetical protein